jgi:photosystem II stability/assembly factor-like uncharacterized protein
MLRPLIALLVLATVACCADRPMAWEPLGLSGGGAMFVPTISPHDGREMMVECDMSAAYLTKDAGTTWRMIPHTQLGSNIQCAPVFHPVEPHTIVAADGWGGTLAISRDDGEHWEKLGEIGGRLRGGVAIDGEHPERMLAGSEDGVWRSLDAGRTWARCSGPAGAVVGLHLPAATPHPETARTWFAASVSGIWRSDDAGATWSACDAGLPWRDLRGFAASTPANGSGPYLWCTIPGKAVDGAYAGGIWRSSDGGAHWSSAMGDGLNREIKPFDQWAMGEVAQYHQLLACDSDPKRVYAFNANTGIPPPHHTAVYRSDDGGATWKPTFFPDPRYPGCNVEPDYTVATVHQFYQDIPGGVAIDPRHPDHVIQVDGGRCYLTADGGRTWTCGHTRPKPGQPEDKPLDWLCNGLVVTTTWNHYQDPSDPKRHYICYTDIGFAISADDGASWRWWPQEGRSPWGNTCYELALDPAVPGRAWGAFSNVHDIPNGNIIWGNHNPNGAGGVCVSSDHCLTWTPCTGLPKAPVTSIVLDPSSPKDKRVIYAGVFGHGVFRSGDGGVHWEERSKGLGSDEDLRVTRVVLHRDGTVFAVVTAARQEKRFVAQGPGVYRSHDQGGTWELVPGSNHSLWPKDLTVDPADSRVLYLGACDTPGAQTGGLYRTRDGGATWQLLARKGPEHFGAYLHPHRKGWLYMTLTEGAPDAGLWMSIDDGATWKALDIPFGNVQRVSVDPRNDDVIYATTFGGSVWRGPAEPVR